MIPDRAKLLFVREITGNVTGLCYIADGSLVVSTDCNCNFTVYNEKGEELAHMLSERCKSRVLGLGVDSAKSILVARTGQELLRYQQEGIKWYETNVCVRKTPIPVAILWKGYIIWACQSDGIQICREGHLSRYSGV